MSYRLHDFEIHLTNEDPRQNTKVRAFARRKKRNKIVKSKDGLNVNTIKLEIFTTENKMIQRIVKDEDIRKDFLDKDEEIDLEIAGKITGRTTTLLVNSENNLCYNFTEYEIKKNRQNKIIKCEICNEIYCEHRIKHQNKSNIDINNSPVRWINIMMMDKLEVIKKWSFSDSYQIRHVDGLTYKHLYEMAKKLQESNKMVLMAPIENKKPQKLILRSGGKPFYGWLEGRIQDDKYALILHRTTLKLVD